jgi:hypothetical protein
MLANYQRLLDMGYNAEQVEDVASAYAENKVSKSFFSGYIVLRYFRFCRISSSQMTKQRWRIGARRQIFSPGSGANVYLPSRVLPSPPAAVKVFSFLFV